MTDPGVFTFAGVTGDHGHLEVGRGERQPVVLRLDQDIREDRHRAAALDDRLDASESTQQLIAFDR